MVIETEVRKATKLSPEYQGFSNHPKPPKSYLTHTNDELSMTYTGPRLGGCTVPVGRVVLLDL